MYHYLSTYVTYVYIHPSSPPLSMHVVDAGSRVPQPPSKPQRSHLPSLHLRRASPRTVPTYHGGQQGEPLLLGLICDGCDGKSIKYQCALMNHILFKHIQNQNQSLSLNDLLSHPRKRNVGTWHVWKPFQSICAKLKEKGQHWSPHHPSQETSLRRDPKQPWQNFTQPENAHPFSPCCQPTSMISKKLEIISLYLPLAPPFSIKWPCWPC